MASAIGPDYRAQRRRLIEMLQAGGISDLAVLRAIELVPRHLFVSTGMQQRAYEDTSLPIGNQQTISQPSVHARYLQLLGLKGTERVLEIGTGSGYQTALLSHLAAQVFSVERVGPLLTRAKEVFKELKLRNVSTLLGDGTVGWRDYSPFQAILVSAGGPSIPKPLLEQLDEGGHLLIPLGDRETQTLVQFTRRGDSYERRDIAPVRFVPLVGTHGWTGQ